MSTLSEKIKAMLAKPEWSYTAEDRSTFSEVLEIVRSHDCAVDRQSENEKNLKGARDQACAQCSSIVEMVAAFECDYDRLEELTTDQKYLQGEITDEYETLADIEKRLAECIADNPKSVYIVEIESDIVSQRARIKTAENELAEWVTETHAELTELQEAAGECESQEEAIERIQDDALDISVRSDWHSPGSEDNEPTEFTILLCTGGPAVRIVGELDEYRQPSRAWIEYQDWFTAWTHLIDAPIESDTLLTYCQQFYFGE